MRLVLFWLLLAVVVAAGVLGLILAASSGGANGTAYVVPAIMLGCAAVAIVEFFRSALRRSR